jgi:REP element-mobilizing transposase RayT
VGVPLPEVVGWFKTMTTNAYIRGVRDQGWPRFDGRLWQRNYFERVLRDDERLNAARRYISENPRRWADDPEHVPLARLREEDYPLL